MSEKLAILDRRVNEVTGILVSDLRPLSNFGVPVQCYGPINVRQRRHGVLVARQFRYPYPGEESSKSLSPITCIHMEY